MRGIILFFQKKKRPRAMDCNWGGLFSSLKVIVHHFSIKGVSPFHILRDPPNSRYYEEAFNVTCSIVFFSFINNIELINSDKITINEMRPINPFV